jgi:broad specificity phosphatase PhoE
MKLFFTRHAETSINVEKRVQMHDHGDITDKGMLQIKDLKDRLREEQIDLIISSDSPRCKITSEEINKILNKEIIYNKLVREKGNGLWEGKRDNEVNWDSLEGTFETRKAPDGENLVEVRDRGRRFLQDLMKNKKYSDLNILVVSHGAFLKVLIGDLIGTDIEKSVFNLLIDHCSLTLVDFDKKYRKGYQIKYVNNLDFQR